MKKKWQHTSTKYNESRLLQVTIWQYKGQPRKTYRGQRRQDSAMRYDYLINKWLWEYWTTTSKWMKLEQSKNHSGGKVKHGRGIGWGYHFLTHGKIIWTLSKYHKTTSECWQRTQAPRKAAHYLWKEVGQNIKYKQRDKRVRDGDLSWGESPKRGEVHKHQETLSRVGLWGVLNHREQHNWKEKINKTHRLRAYLQFPVE